MHLDGAVDGQVGAEGVDRRALLGGLENDLACRQVDVPEGGGLGLGVTAAGGERRESESGAQHGSGNCVALHHVSSVPLSYHFGHPPPGPNQPLGVNRRSYPPRRRKGRLLVIGDALIRLQVQTSSSSAVKFRVTLESTWIAGDIVEETMAFLM